MPADGKYRAEDPAPILADVKSEPSRPDILQRRARIIDPLERHLRESG